MEYLSNDHEDRPNQDENSHKLCDETGHLFMNFMESQRTLRQHDQNFQWRESHFRTNTSVRRKKEIQKGSTMTITVWDPCRKINRLGKVF